MPKFFFHSFILKFYIFVHFTFKTACNCNGGFWWDSFKIKIQYIYFHHKIQFQSGFTKTDENRFKVLFMILLGLLTGKLPAGVDCCQQQFFIPYAEFTLPA